MVKTKALFKVFPDFDKSTEEQLAAVSAKLETLSPEMLAKVLDPVNGIPARQAYAPSVFHIEEFVKAEEAKAQLFKPAPTSYKRLNPSGYPEGFDCDVESRKRTVERELRGHR